MSHKPWNAMSQKTYNNANRNPAAGKSVHRDRGTCRAHSIQTTSKNLHWNFEQAMDLHHSKGGAVKSYWQGPFMLCGHKSHIRPSSKQAIQYTVARGFAVTLSANHWPSWLAPHHFGVWNCSRFWLRLHHLLLFVCHNPIIFSLCGDHTLIILPSKTSHERKAIGSRVPACSQTHGCYTVQCNGYLPVSTVSHDLICRELWHAWCLKGIKIVEKKKKNVLEQADTSTPQNDVMGCCARWKNDLLRRMQKHTKLEPNRQEPRWQRHCLKKREKELIKYGAPQY